METELSKILEEARKEIDNAKCYQDLSNANNHFLGKSSKMSEILKNLKNVPVEERKTIGAEVNKIRDAITVLLDEKTALIDELLLNEKLEGEKIDITIPVKPFEFGVKNPLEEIKADLITFFSARGYTLMQGTDIETDYYCFEALNVPKEHPAREAQDTFYIDAERLLRTHTSSVQIHTMEGTTPPIKMMSTGNVYRVDEVDATHSPLFNQFEILVVDKNVTMGDLKGVLLELVQHLLGEKTQIRLRPSFFPFTEPSVEADATCPKCGGKGCSMCKDTGYIELLGAGMVHPNVLKNCGIDSTVYSGFAAGLGLDRILMLKYGITDIRDLYENDINFLKQFK